ncbi:TIGR03758 family integrating conjugative element protein [Salinicola peritrichatus]|uniref:TIGR03758 family integrating conjugative element protein n=1 Tax=Salinicola peritrichatus TaxID=1267424 RepID=UPI000DA14933|nr:TIGR03758 family integrating conjugative element protein [Salinicola peritrichatus]
MEAFEAGSGMEAAPLNWMLAGLGCVAVLLCVSWILISAYRGYARGRVDGDIFGVVWWRALLLLVLFLWLFL